MPSFSNVALIWSGTSSHELLFALGRLPVVDDLVEVDPVEPVGPGRHRALHEVIEGAKPVLEHPVRLVLEAR